MGDQPPLWDGTGVDPWLPARLAAEARIVEAEQVMYTAWWAAFAAWIVQVNRGVLSAGVPDPYRVFAFEPAWTAHMDRFVAGPVTQTIGLAYDTIFGEGWHFDSRPAVVRHLATVANRMAGTPHVVFDKIAGEIAEGANIGDSIPDIAARVDQVLSATGTDTWRGRGVTVARTETLGALNCGRSSAFSDVAAELDEEFESMWLATIDLRVRDAPGNGEGGADLQRVPVGTPFTVGGEQLAFPGDPTGSPSNIINCRCTTLLMRPGENVDLSDRGWKTY